MTIWQSILAAIRSGAWVGYVGTLIGLATTIGLLNQDQANAAAQIVSGVATLVTLVVSLVHTVQTAGLLRRNAALRALKTPAERIP